MPLRILLLEDDPSLAYRERELLELHEHTVEWTPNGVEALVMAARSDFDLAILDVEVDELSGLGIERVLRDIGDIAVAVVSARSNGWRRSAFSAGAIACLQKPLDVVRLPQLAHAVEVGGRRGPPLPGDVRSLSRDELQRVSRMSASEIDALPFGVFRLDRAGRIVVYNAFEATAAGLDREQVLGRRFADIAPCMLVKEFVAAAERARHGDHVDEVMRFVFPHHSAACLVTVRLYSEESTGELWLFVSKRARPQGSEPIVLP
jgi:photoactive yellow protein